MAEKKNLMEALLEEISRVKEMIELYKSLPGKAGILASRLMELDVKKAEEAISSGELIDMIRIFEALKKYQN